MNQEPGSPMLELGDLESLDLDSLSAVIETIIGVTDAEQLLTSSQIVMQITDETDFEEASIFSIEAWTQLLGLNNIDQTPIDQIPG